MRVNIWNVAGWNSAGNGIKVYHCALGWHECAVHCGHPEDPAHSKDRLILFSFLEVSGLSCILFPGLVPFFPYVFNPVCSYFLANSRIRSFYFLIVSDLISLSVTHLMFYSCKTHTFKQFLSYVPTNLQSLSFLSCIASWGLSLSLKPGHDVNAAYWRQGSDSRREKVRAIGLIMNP